MIALYNTEKKQLMAVFKEIQMASVYLYGSRSRERSRLWVRMIDKVRIVNSRFPFPVAVREANSKQVKLVGDKDGIIFEGYPVANRINVSGTVYKKFENEKTHESLL
jgi:hypothetical protein